MRGKGITVREAAEMWVREMNQVQQGMIQKLMEADPDDWTEVTMPAYADRVYYYEGTENGEYYGEIEKVDDENELYIIDMDDGTKVTAKKDDFEVVRDDGLPMWGWMWSFGDSADDWWMEEGDGIKLMSECGFRVYESQEFGYWFGIDGAGYDFYGSHWVPAYRARGLHWHDEATEKKEVV